MKEPSNRKIHFHTLGCRLNQFESDSLEALSLTRKNLEETYHIINTCSVTGQADARCRNLIRSLHRKDPHAKIIVTGCYAQEDRGALEKIPGVFRVILNTYKSHLLDLLEGERIDTPGEAPFDRKLKRNREGRPLPEILDPFHYGQEASREKTRSSVKIQEGCDMRCSYCRVPFSRGGGQSRPSREVLEHLQHLDSLGIPEIVLVGVNTGAWREGKDRIWDLVERILDLNLSARIRLSSLELHALGSRAGRVFSRPGICRFLHVPLQSGSTRILRRMRRGYTREKFQEKLHETLGEAPPLFLGTDVMVGYPGETEEDFQETLDLVGEFRFPKIHAFRFSPREGTPAALEKGRLSGRILERRVALLTEREQENRENYLNKIRGDLRHCVVEKEAGIATPGRALSDDGISVLFQDPDRNYHRGKIHRFQIEEPVGEDLACLGIPLPGPTVL